MAINTLSYTGRDVSEIRRELIDMIPTLTSKWTDFNTSDIGITIIELIAGAQDMQNFYFDTQTFETYLDTAQQPKNIRSLLRTMNYRIPLMSAARGTVTLIFEDNSYKEVTIPKYTVVNSTYADITVSYAVSETVIENGEFEELEVPVVEGEVKTFVTNKRKLKSNVNVAGNVSRRIYLGFKNVADSTVTIEQNGVIWEEVDDALLKYNGGYYFSVHVDSEGQVYVLMSVDFMDLLPSDEEEDITIRFVITNGLDGTVDEEVLNDISMNIEGLVDVNNEEATSGASNGVNLQRAKILAREKAITMDRFITLEDYRNGVLTEPYIQDCVVKDWKYPEYVNEPYIVRIWAIDYEGKPLGSEYAKILKNKLYEKGNVEVTVEIAEPELLQLDIDVVIDVNARTLSDKELIREAVENNLRTGLMQGEMEFGYSLSYSEIKSTVLDTSSKIKSVVINKPDGNFECTEIQYPVVGNISVKLLDTL